MEEQLEDFELSVATVSSLPSPCNPSRIPSDASASALRTNILHAAATASRLQVQLSSNATQCTTVLESLQLTQHLAAELEVLHGFAADGGGAAGAPCEAAQREAKAARACCALAQEARSKALAVGHQVLNMAETLFHITFVNACVDLFAW
jgi:hypothetical protein